MDGDDEGGRGRVVGAAEEAGVIERDKEADYEDGEYVELGCWSLWLV